MIVNLKLIQLTAKESGKSLHQISADIGVPLTTLAAWVKQFKTH